MTYKKLNRVNITALKTMSLTQLINQLNLAGSLTFVYYGRQFWDVKQALGITPHNVPSITWSTIRKLPPEALARMVNDYPNGFVITVQGVAMLLLTRLVYRY